jgi:excisionase family DNA binding protein
MAKLIPENLETAKPSEADVRLAGESSRRLASRKLGRRASIRLRFEDGGEAEDVSVPASAVRLFIQMLTEMSQGNSVTLIPNQTELTTQQAADLLNVSHRYVVKLLDEGEIPFRTVGEYRRLRFDDLMAFKRKDDDARAKILDQLTAEAQELGMGY